MSTVTIENASTQKHPVALTATVVLKAIPVVAYCVCEIFNSDFVQNFIACVLLLAVDFWTTKNVSGRLLVGLRFWNEIDERGESRWRFESRDEEGMTRVDKRESRAFWFSLYAGALGWFGLLIGAVAALEFNYALIPLIAVILASSNAVGYYKCSKDQQEQLKSGLTSFATRHAASAVFGAGR